MSKIGKTPVLIPDGVDVSIDNKNCLITVKGPKGELKYNYPKQVEISCENSKVVFDLNDDTFRNYWGLVRSLVNNMVVGVTEGYEKKLLILGVGFSAKVEGKNLILSLGFSHLVKYNIKDGINISVDKDPKGNPMVIISGINKQLVGQTAAQIRAIKKPEPYKGKGIRYFDEIIKMKAGKTAKK